MSTSISTTSHDHASSSQHVPIRSYKTLVEAERAVDRLTECRFPREYVTLGAHGARACAHRSASTAFSAEVLRGGRLAGAALFAIALLVAGVAAQGPTLAVFLGATGGAVLGFCASAILAGRTPTCDCHAMGADRYEILVDAQWAQDAEHVLTVADCP